MVESIQGVIVNNVINEANKDISKTWAQIASGDATKLITEVVQVTSGPALSQSVQLIEANFAERRRKSRNIIVSNLPDSSAETESDLKELICKTVKYEIVPADIVQGGLSLLVPHRRYLAVFGGIWRYLAVFGGIWRYLAVFGGIWRYLAVFGGIWRYLAVFGGIWRYLAVFGGIWRYLAVFGGIWRYLAVFGICVFYASCQLSGCIRSSVYISITAINDHK